MLIAAFGGLLGRPRIFDEQNHFEPPSCVALFTMVLINLKLPQGDQSEAADGFLLEASCSTRKVCGLSVDFCCISHSCPFASALTVTDDLISSLVEIHNLRLRSRLISESVRALADFGPMNEEEEVSQGVLSSYGSRIEFTPCVTG